MPAAASVAESVLLDRPEPKIAEPNIAEPNTRHAQEPNTGALVGGPPTFAKLGVPRGANEDALSWYSCGPERRLTTDPSRLSRTLAGAIVRVPISPQPISATAIRAALARGATGRAEIAGLLPPAVLAYIDRNQLYRSSTDAT